MSPGFSVMVRQGSRERQGECGGHQAEDDEEDQEKVQSESLKEPLALDSLAREPGSREYSSRESSQRGLALEICSDPQYDESDELHLSFVCPEVVLVNLQLDEILPKRVPQITADAVVVEEVLKTGHLQMSNSENLNI